MPRLMAFIDGENLTSRFEAMLKDGWVPRRVEKLYEPGPIVHEAGRFVWSPSTIFGVPSREDLLRVHYYTTFSGATDDFERFKEFLTQQKVIRYQGESQMMAVEHMQLVPRVFHKTTRGTKTKSVDINLSVEMLEYIRQNALDSIYLVTGDVDYLPLIEAAMRAGKKVYVAALSSGLSRRLEYSADKFISLNNTYFTGSAA